MKRETAAGYSRAAAMPPDSGYRLLDAARTLLDEPLNEWVFSTAVEGITCSLPIRRWRSTVDGCDLRDT